MLRNSLCRRIQTSTSALYRLQQQCNPRFAPAIHRVGSRELLNVHVVSGFSTNPGGKAKMPRPPPPPEDGLTRYPRLDSAQGVLRGLDLFGTAVFAYSGCVTAGTCGMDLLGCTIVGTITAVGGGTVRDVLLGNSPVFWMKEVEYLWLCVLTSLGTFAAYSNLTDQDFKESGELLNWADAFGVGAFCIIGAQNAVRHQLSTAVCVACGMFTATFGGIIRDVLCQKPPRILHSKAEIYASTALAGAGTYMLLRKAKLPPIARIAGGFTVATMLRVFAWKMNIRLPTWAESPQYSQIVENEKGVLQSSDPKVVDAKS